MESVWDETISLESIEVWLATVNLSRKVLALTYIVIEMWQGYPVLSSEEPGVVPSPRWEPKLH
jgi:hypothetical protein